MAYFSIPAINKMKGSVLSRIVLLTFASFAIFTSAIALGRTPGLHLFLVPIGWTTLVLFDLKAKKSIGFLITLITGLLIGFETMGSDIGSVYTPNSIQAKWIRSYVLFSTLIGQIALMIKIFHTNRETESKLVRAAQKARTADLAKSHFLAKMSHEIRTPLNGILGMSSLLLKNELTVKQKEWVQAIQNSGLDLMSTISEILDLSKIEAGKMPLEKGAFAVREVLNSVMRPFKYETTRKGIRFNLESPIDLPSQLYGDDFRLKQVLNILLANTIRLTRDGKISLSLWANPQPNSLPREPQTVVIRFRIEAEGIKIPQVLSEDLFQPFSHPVSTSRDLNSGTGLGLFLSKQIVELMGGTIQYFQKSEHIGFFQFEIPFEEVVNHETGDPFPGLIQEHPMSMANIRMLIVEDHPLNQKVLAGFLYPYGCQVDMVNGGREAVEAFIANPYHLILMDCHMPGMDGFESTLRLRELKPLGKKLIIIGVTADAMQATREKCFEAGMDEVLYKPIIAAELKRALSHWLKIVTEVAPPPTMPSQISEWVDIEHLKGMDEWVRAFDPEFWTRSQDQFRESAHRIIAQIREAGQAKQYEKLSESAHTLKGLCLMMGLRRMSEGCKKMERSPENDLDWQNQVNELESNIEPSLEEMQNSIKNSR